MKIPKIAWRTLIDNPYILCNRMFIVFQVSSVKIFLSPLRILFSNNWIPLSILGISWWSVVSSITKVFGITSMHMWSFCARASSGFQYELNSHYIMCLISNAHNTLF